MELTDISVVRSLMEKHGLRFQKKFGQNFLINRSVPERIAEASGAGGEDGVLEIGPGIGTGKTAEAILNHVLGHTALPLVMDADALNLLRGDPAKVRNYPGPCVLTPHVMEMSRLSGLSCEEIKQDPKAAAQKIAEQSGAIVILKDAVTMIAAPEGPVCLYAEGGSELATAGSGDVLAGIVVSLAAQCPDNLFRDAVLAVCLHGYSGKKAAECLSKAAVTAGDLTAHLAF